MRKDIGSQNPIEKYITQLTRVSVFGKFELLNYLCKGDKRGNIYILLFEVI